MFAQGLKYLGFIPVKFHVLASNSVLRPLRPSFISLAFPHATVRATASDLVSRSRVSSPVNESHRRDGSGSQTKLLWGVSSAFALLTAGIHGDKDPNGKTRTEKLLEVSRKQLDEEINARREAKGVVVSWLLRNVWQPLLTWLRFAQLFAYFTPVLLLALPIALGICTHSYRLFWYHYLVMTLQAAGPSFIKLGQWAASRADIFPSEMCEEMGRLHSKAKQHGMAHTRKVVSEAFGKPFEDCFEEFDSAPLGIGAMGQVYKAKYKSDEFEGDVAVKVLHPHVETLVTRDLTIMMSLARLINAIPTMEWLSLPGEVETFGRMMRSQLDFRLEADNLRVFNELFSGDKDISFPEPSLEGSTRQVLVEQLVLGVSMEKVLKYVKHTDFDKSVAALGLDAFLKMLLLHNFIHSDLHAGNIFLTIDGEEEKLAALKAAKNQDDWDKVWNTLSNAQPHLWFIDAGLVTELNPNNRANFVALFKAIATFDGYKAGELMVERSRTPETVIDKEVFALKTSRLVSQVKSRTFALGSVSIGDLLTNMMEMVRKHHVRMESDFITVILSILLLEGIGRRLDPELDIFKSALPVLRRVSQNQATSLPSEDLSFEDGLQMLKVWVVLETRQFITASVQDIYRCVKYDRLSPNN